MIPGIRLIRGIKSKASAAPEAPLSYHKAGVLATTLGPGETLTPDPPESGIQDPDSGGENRE